MYELGNKKTDGQPYRIFYEYINVEYMSIDINGMDGAIVLDLEIPILNLKSRDMVANIGTAEHVMNQEQVFRNIHNLSHFRMVHWVPKEKKRSKHGYWGYTEDFFKMLAELNNYQIEKLYTLKYRHGIVCCSYRKTNSKLYKHIPINCYMKMRWIS